LVVVAVIWPWWVGTYVAVQLGAGNPSTARNVTGWAFEVLWLIAVAVVVIASRSNRQPTASDHMAAGGSVPLIAHQGAPINHVVTPTRRGSSAIYTHGNCPVKHRTPEAATRCRNL
jgi:hypothetical protein